MVNVRSPLTAPGRRLGRRPGEALAPRPPARARGSLAGVKVVLAGADAAALTVAVVAAYLGSDLVVEVRGVRGTTPWLLGVLAVPIGLGLMLRYQLYSARAIARRIDELGRLLHACATTTVVVAFLAVMGDLRAPRAWFGALFVTSLVTLALSRETVRRVVARLRRRGRLLRPVLVAGANAEGRDIATLLRSDLRLGYEVLGFLDDGAGGTPIAGCPVLGPLSRAAELAVETGASGVVVATTGVDVAASNHLVRSLTDRGIHVELSSSLRDIAFERLRVQPLGRFPVVSVEPIRRNGWRAVAKRGFDVAVSAALLIVLAPLAGAIVAGIYLESGRPIYFRQRRVGRDRQPFELLKFRTMVADAETRRAELAHRNEGSGPLFKIRRDPRITRVGRVLRKYSLDELPQLVNVLKGEMSLVGPRPALFSELASWTPVLHDRLKVRPGITGMWQVSGRSELSFDEYARLDLYYVDNWTLWTDVVILAKTAPAVLLGKGSY